jgi:hypothetical protein
VPPITGPTGGFATGVPDLVSSLADLADDGVYDLAIPEEGGRVFLLAPVAERLESMGAERVDWR